MLFVLPIELQTIIFAQYATTDYTVGTLATNKKLTAIRALDERRK